jgi:uncharacterized protein YcbK (DUF882 family)
LPIARTGGTTGEGGRLARRAWLAPLLLLAGFSPSSTETAIANGDTRTITLVQPHSQESGSFTFRVNGVYDSAVLDKLNWFMRDWRRDEPTKMDPRLFDIVWEVYRESGSSMPIEVLSGYRSPETNAMLRRRSRQVAEHSQHMLGKAMDAHFQDVSVAHIRDIGMRLQSGGVGFYPTGGTPWVHLDSGSVRYWPRMNHDQIARLFPDGKTVFVPSDGVPLPGYEQARAEIEARGGDVMSAEAYTGKGLLSLLFGGGEDDAEEGGRGGAQLVASMAPSSRSGGGNAASYFTSQAGQVQVASAETGPVARAQRDLPRGETYLRPEPTPAVTVTAAKPQKPEEVAALEPQTPVANDASPDPAQRSGGLTWDPPTPPHRPSEFSVAGLGFGVVPLPPARPVEFASLQQPDVAPMAADASHGVDAISALLGRKASSGPTRSVDGLAPRNALALLEPNAPDAPERPAPLLRAAALTASLPASLPPAASARPVPKAALVAAHIDRTNYSQMTAAPKASAATPGALQAPAAIVGVQRTETFDLVVAALTPSVELRGAFVAQPYGDLRSDAFTGPAVKALELRGTAN